MPRKFSNLLKAREPLGRSKTPKDPEHQSCRTILAPPSARDALRLLHRGVQSRLVQRGDELLGAEISLNLK